MFSKTSRYRYLPDEVTVDADGASAQSKALRLLGAVTGTVSHTVEEVDRLDHLAYKYFRQPTRWWRICDANPEVESPLALLAGGPVVTYRFPLGTSKPGEAPFPWRSLLSSVTALLGVEDAAPVEEEVKPLEIEKNDYGEPIYEGCFERSLVVRFHRWTTALAEVSEVVTQVLEAAGLVGDQPVEISRVGKRITIPPRSTGRRTS